MPTAPSAAHRTMQESISRQPRLHLQHGPIDLIISADGPAEQVQRSYQCAVVAFNGVLDTLAAQLPLLRQELHSQQVEDAFDGPVARRMFLAARACCDLRVTPMIAVAGSVADHVLQAMRAVSGLERIHVNNGGDIALHLSVGRSSRIGVCHSPRSTERKNTVVLQVSDAVGGVATSGWQGRSHSLGIADAVTVLARDAASADVVATVIGNAVDVPGLSCIERLPACELTPDSDLGRRAVTVNVPELTLRERHHALDAGARLARRLLQAGLMIGACLHLQGETRTVGSLAKRRPGEQERTHT